MSPEIVKQPTEIDPGIRHRRVDFDRFLKSTDCLREISKFLPGVAHVEQRQRGPVTRVLDTAFVRSDGLLIVTRLRIRAAFEVKGLAVRRVGLNDSVKLAQRGREVALLHRCHAGIQLLFRCHDLSLSFVGERPYCIARVLAWSFAAFQFDPVIQPVATVFGIAIQRVRIDDSAENIASNRQIEFQNSRPQP